LSEIKRRKDKAKPFPLGSYEDLPLTDLVLYALFSLEEKGIETTFENLVAESFELFPRRFSLQGYPDYPDANRVRREIQRIEGTLSSLGVEKLADGNMKTSYKITGRGVERLRYVQARLQTGVNEKTSIQKRIEDKRSKMGRVLYELEKHPLYKEYLRSGRNMDVPETLLRDLLFSTMETSYEKLREKMNTLIEYCVALGREDIKEFLLHCKDKHEKIFEDSDGNKTKRK